MIEGAEYEIIFRRRGGNIATAITETPPELVRFELIEELHHSPVLRAELEAGQPEFPYFELAGMELVFAIQRADDTHRFILFVESVRYRGTFSGSTHFSIVAGGALSQLAAHRRSQVCMHERSTNVAARLLKPFCDRFDATVDFAGLSALPEPRDYLTQYRETDAEFVLRLLREDGICVRERVLDDKLQLLFTDTNAALSAAGDDGDREIPVTHAGLDASDVESMVSFELTHRQGVDVYEQRYWSWAPDPEPLDGERRIEGNPWLSGATSEHAAVRVSENDGAPTIDPEQRTRIAHDARLVEVETATAVGNVIGLEPGTAFELVDHPHGELNREWLAIRVVHRGSASVDGQGVSSDTGYVNRAVCVPVGVRFRPGWGRGKPRIYGLQTAVVTGPAGEEVHTDRFGRVRVRMLWDRGNSADEESSCWIRVAQSWAGPGFGTMFIPRIGMEVVVSFLDGDPDRPLITGCVYNGANTTPYPLPDEKTKSTLKTASSPAAEGFNELTFEDAAGNEEVFLHAQRNLREVVKAAHTQSVGATQAVSVGADQTTSVEGNRSVQVAGTESITVAGSSDAPTAAARSVTVQTGAHNIVVADGAMLVDASESITLKCGQSMVMVTPSGIALQAADGAAIELSTLLSMQAKTAASTMTLGADGLAGITAKVATIEGDESIALTRGGSNGVWLDGNARVCADGGAELELDENGALRGAKVDVTANGAGVILDRGRATMSGGQAVQVAVNEQNGVSISSADIKVQGAAAELGGQTVTVAGKLVQIN